MRVKETRFGRAEEPVDHNIATPGGDAHAASGDEDGYLAVLEALEADAVDLDPHNVDGDFSTRASYFLASATGDGDDSSGNSSDEASTA